MKLFHNKDWIEEKGEEIVIGDIVLSSKIKLDNITIGNVKVDKRFKQGKSNDKRNWDFDRFPYGRDYKYGWHNNGSTERLSLRYPVPG